MFQKDYWKMPDKELLQRARKFNIQCTKGAMDHIFDREKAINELLLRDNAVRTRLTVVISILAFIFSVAAFLKSFFS